VRIGTGMIRTLVGMIATAWANIFTAQPLLYHVRRPLCALAQRRLAESYALTGGITTLHIIIDGSKSRVAANFSPQRCGGAASGHVEGHVLL
jgi:hypothetical protein